MSFRPPLNPITKLCIGFDAPLHLTHFTSNTVFFLIGLIGAKFTLLFLLQISMEKVLSAEAVQSLHGACPRLSSVAAAELFV